MNQTPHPVKARSIILAGLKHCVRADHSPFLPLDRPDLQTPLRLWALVLPQVVARAVVETLEAVTSQSRASGCFLLLSSGRSPPVGGGQI